MALPFLPINLLIGASFSAYRCPPGQAWRLRLTTVTSNCRLDLIDVLAMLQAFAPVVPDADGLASLFHCRAAWRCRDGEGERGGAVSKKCVETNPSYRLVPTRKGHHPLFMYAGKVFGDVLPRKLVTIEGSAVHSAKVGSQNGNPS
jgi:hypothetical protein